MSLDRLEHLLAAAWRGDVPMEEAALARALSTDKVDLAIARLDAILSVERGGAVKDAAAALSMDRVAFFRLRQRWAAQRSLRSLVPFAGRAPRRVGVGRADELRLVTDMIASAERPPHMLKLVDALQAQSARLSRQTAMRLVREAIARASAGVDEIARELGEEVLVDFAGTAMSVEGGVVAVCLVVETASRFILGHAAGKSSELVDLMASAMASAAAMPRFSDMLAEPAHARAPGRLRIVLPPAAVGVGVGDAIAESAAGRSILRIVDAGERRYGRGLVGLLGHRVARMSLHPRALSTGEAPRHGIATARHLDLDDARAFVFEAVRDHNAARNRLLVDSIGSEDGEGAADLIKAVAGLPPREAFAALCTGYDLWKPGAERLASTLLVLDRARGAIPAAIVSPRHDAPG